MAAFCPMPQGNRTSSIVARDPATSELGATVESPWYSVQVSYSFNNKGEYWRRGERVELSGERNARQAGFEDRSRHRPRSSSSLIYRALGSTLSSKLASLVDAVRRQKPRQ